jgi:ribosome-associated protein
MIDSSPLPSDFLTVSGELSIPMSEIRFTADRGTGPGGQHVNKVSTRVTLHFQAAGSPSLNEAQRELVLARLKGRVNQEGELKVVAGEYRSQSANKAAALARFAALMRQALARQTPRRATRPTRASKQRRLAAKKQRGFIKTRRAGPTPDD